MTNQRRLLFTGLLVLCFFTVSATFAQQIDFLKLVRSPMMQRSQQAAGRALADSMWNGNGGNMLAIQLVDEPEIREAWGITDEQQQRIKATVTDQSLFVNQPEFPGLVAEMGKFMDPADIFMEKASKERLDGFTEVQEKIVGLAMNAIPAEINNILTEEQNQKLLEFQLAGMSEMPIITPSSFEALGLSEEQKKELEAVKKELEADFTKMMDETMEMSFRHLGKIYDKIAEEGVEIKDGKALHEKITDATKQLEELAKTDENVRRDNEEIQKKGLAFMTRLKFKVFDILTDEQMAKLEALVDHQPEYVKIALKRMKEKQGLDDNTSSIQTFFDAWKPGEAIPEEYRQHRRKKNFPTEEN